MNSKSRRRSEDRYEIDLVPNEHGGYYARIPDFPTVFSGGETPQEAMANALEAVELMIEEQHERGLPVPEPLAAYSGQFNLRLPRSLHRELVRRARSQGVSLNALVTFLLAQATGRERAQEVPTSLES
jgi:antitoxin HicB